MCIDPYHRRVLTLRPEPGPGVDLVIVHGLLGVRFLRFGKILTWQDGHGYSFSDISARGPRRGFPHVFAIRIEPLGPTGERSRLVVEVKGRWTAGWIPRWLRDSWLTFTCAVHA